MNGVQAGPPGSGQGSGKVILFGEHAVVHGRPAIAAALSRGCSARAQATADSESSLRVEPWGVQVRSARPEADPERELLRRAFAVVCEHCSPGRQAVSVQAAMEIPSGAGLGSSAALSVAVIRAIDTALQQQRSAADVLAASLAWERVFHGNPSGVDSAMAMGGGLRRFVRGAEGPVLTPLHTTDALHVVVGNSAEHGSTKAMVERVAEHLHRDPVGTGSILDAIGAVVDSAQRALEAADLAQLGRLMDENQRRLEALGLSTPKLEQMCHVARNAGALGAKLTGGGGGGCMIALAADGSRGQLIARALSDAGHAAFVVEVSG
jgi:mevalonate kinase